MSFRCAGSGAAVTMATGIVYGWSDFADQLEHTLAADVGHQEVEQYDARVPIHRFEMLNGLTPARRLDGFVAFVPTRPPLWR